MDEWYPGDGFDALLRGHLRPDFQSIQYLSRSAPVSQRPILDNSLDNSLGPWSEDQGPSTKVLGPRTLSRGSWTAFRVSSFSAAASRTPNRGYLGWLLELDRFGSRGGRWFGVVSSAYFPSLTLFLPVQVAVIFGARTYPNLLPHFRSVLIG